MKERINAKSIIVLAIALLTVVYFWLSGDLESRVLGGDLFPEPTENIGQGPSDQPTEKPSSSDKVTEKPSPSEQPTETPSPNPTTRPRTLEVHFIDVGNGDSIFIRTPSKDILIDGGERNSKAFDYLISLGIDELDLVIGTHPHSDHIGGLVKVLENIRVKQLMDPGVVHTSKTYEDYLTLIYEKDILYTNVKAGVKLSLDNEISLEILHPTHIEGKDLNNVSVVTRLVYNKISFLFTADAEIVSEQEILAQGYNVASTILKAGHHGSSTSTGDDFLKAVNPKVVVISCGQDNSYGHPHQETLDKLEALDIDVYRTDELGSIIIETDGKNYIVKTER